MYQVNEILCLDDELFRVLKIAGKDIVWIALDDKNGGFNSEVHNNLSSKESHVFSH